MLYPLEQYAHGVQLRLDHTSPVAIYAQVAAAVRREVAAGRVGRGDRLPAARDLADGLGINVHTVLKGYQELRDEGLVELRRGRGAVVTARAADVAGPRQAVIELVEQARRAGLGTDEVVQMVRAGMAT